MRKTSDCGFRNKEKYENSSDYGLEIKKSLNIYLICLGDKNTPESDLEIQKSLKIHLSVAWSLGKA